VGLCLCVYVISVDRRRNNKTETPRLERHHRFIELQVKQRARLSWRLKSPQKGRGGGEVGKKRGSKAGGGNLITHKPTASGSRANSPEWRF